MERLALITATDVCLKLSDTYGEAAVIEFVQLLNNLSGRDAISSLMTFMNWQNPYELLACL